MRLIFINRFYWPDEPATAQLLTDLAETLVRRGHEVIVIASHPRTAGVPRTEIRHGVQIVRVGSSRSAHGGVAAKALDFATFHLTAIWRLLVTARRNDVLVAMTDPPMLGVGVAVVAGVRSARLFHWAQDIYPELAIELSGHGWLHLLRPLRDWAWRAADGCVTLGEDMAAVIARAGVATDRISIAPNWAPTGLAPQPPAAAAKLRAEWQLHGKFVVAYSGNLGRVHDLDPVLDLAEAMRADTRIAFLFVGGGAQRAALETAAAQRGLSNVQFRPAQPRARLVESLLAGDLHLVTVRPGCERYVFPSKLYGIAAVGRPVLFIGPRDCELARLVRDREIGRAFDRAEIAALAEEIRVLAAQPENCARLGQRAAQFSHDLGGVAAAAAHWHALAAGAQACDATRPLVSSTRT